MKHGSNILLLAVLCVLGAGQAYGDTLADVDAYAGERLVASASPAGLWLGTRHSRDPAELVGQIESILCNAASRERWWGGFMDVRGLDPLDEFGLDAPSRLVLELARPSRAIEQLAASSPVYNVVAAPPGNSVPEPSNLVILLGAVAALTGRRRRRRSRVEPGATPCV